MRGIFGFTAAAILLGAGAPAALAQRRPVPPVPRVHPVTAPMPRAVRLPNRTITYVRRRPAPPPVRVPATAPTTTAIQPRTPSPAISPISSTTGASSPRPRVTSYSGTPVPLGQLLNSAPGLGFDYSHMAAINRDLAVRALIDPLTQHELALASRLPQARPVTFFGGFGGYAAAPPLVIQTPQPQVIVIQPPAAAPAPAPAPQAAPAAAAAPPAPPLPDVGQFLLVRRDGKVIHAVAFTRQGSRIVYITAGGLRHSLALRQLNVPATEQRNAEHGTILHLTTD